MTLRSDPLLQATADLRWLLRRPLLQLGAPLPDWLRALIDSPPATLAQAPQSPPLPLGHYAEQLLATALAQHPMVAELHSNLAIRQGGVTHGEFDLLVRPQLRTAFDQLELAVKFFLGVASTAGATSWLGLNPRDGLARKYRHLRQQQLCLAELPAAQAQLKARGILIDGRYGWMAGVLFYPLCGDPMPSPDGVEANHRRGWWSHVSHWQPHPACRYQWLAQRLDWLAGPAEPQFAAPSEIVAAARQRPQMLKVWRSDDAGRWRCQGRGVLVPDAWPGQTGLSAAAV